MKDMIKSAVTLSILSAPSKLGMWDELSFPPEEILKRLMYNDLKTQEIIAREYSLNSVKASDLIIERCIRKKINIVTIWDQEYPQLLKEIHNPPLVLYSTGEITGSKMISIVGTRDSDAKSEEITKIISQQAAMAGYTIVSGMAFGIDRNAHIGALMSGGRTVAVLPGGVDVVYPYKNIDLYKMILESGFSAVISEYPPGIGSGQKWTFARRNRIISGVSGIVIVIQASLKSGAMITARYAIEQNRDLFVCPGNAFDEKYSGCHELIRQGAAVFFDMSDLFPDYKGDTEPLKFRAFDKKEPENTAKVKKDVEFKDEVCYPAGITGRAALKIYEDLQNGVIYVDNFIRRYNFSADEVNQAVTSLEIAGYIDRIGNRVSKL